MARVAVYTHNTLRVKRREDLEDDTIAAVLLECGLPNQKGILVCVGYRQWRLVGQPDNTSATVNAQLARWSVFLDKWEVALQEDKEVIVAMDNKQEDVHSVQVGRLLQFCTLIGQELQLSSSYPIIMLHLSIAPIG